MTEQENMILVRIEQRLTNIEETQVMFREETADELRSVRKEISGLRMAMIRQGYAPVDKAEAG